MGYSRCDSCSSLDGQHPYKLFTAFHWTVALHPNQSKIGRITFVLGRHESRFGLLNKDERQDLISAREKVISVCASLFGTTNFSFRRAPDFHLCFVLTPIIKDGIRTKELVAKKGCSGYKEIIISTDVLEEIRQEIIAALIKRKCIDECNLEVIPFNDRIQGVLQGVRKMIVNGSAALSIGQSIFIPSRL